MKRLTQIFQALLGVVVLILTALVTIGRLAWRMEETLEVASPLDCNNLYSCSCGLCCSCSLCPIRG